jgi:hypothetical protein
LDLDVKQITKGGLESARLGDAGKIDEESKAFARGDIPTSTPLTTILGTRRPAFISGMKYQFAPHFAA